MAAAAAPENLSETYILRPLCRATASESRVRGPPPAGGLPSSLSLSMGSVVRSLGEHWNHLAAVNPSVVVPGPHARDSHLMGPGYTQDTRISSLAMCQVPGELLKHATAGSPLGFKESESPRD